MTWEKSSVNQEPRHCRFIDLNGRPWKSTSRRPSLPVSSARPRPQNGAGFFFVGKKDGTLRLCIDYRALNDITVKNRYPLPLMNTTFELLQDAWVFTKLDLRNAYHLVHIREGHELKTEFNTPTGHWEYLVMLFRLTHVPAVFQALVNDVLRDMINNSVFVYLDDIHIFSSSPVEHTRHVCAVLKRLLENTLFIKAEKCEFSCAHTTFLSFIIETRNIRMNPENIKGVTGWPTPTDRKSLQEPILVHPDLEVQFIIEVDASNIGVGALLSQRSSRDSKVHPCAFLSHRLSAAEQNYDIGNHKLWQSRWTWRSGATG